MQKKQKKSFRSIFTLAVSSWIILSLFILSGCSKDTSAYDPYAEYLMACEDAANLTPGKISRSLTAIRPDNANLIWENNEVGSRILVVSWVSQNVCDAYKCPAGGCLPADTCKEGRDCQYGWDTYVTLAPEIKNYFKNKKISPSPMRIAQLLGLPPTAAQTKACFLELWVSPNDLFRPSPDPEVTDQEAELGFPGGQFSSRFRQYNSAEMVFAEMDCDPEQCPSCNDWGQCGFTTYENYIKNRKKYIYTAATPYPWTSLGYTYDWGDPTNHIGLSEFVVNGKKIDGSKISTGIKAVIPTAEYFIN
ncbi:MAG: hypothetical protein K4571_19140 [Deltaproteobacteria bacterium]